MSDKYDIVLYGATGFTGRLATAYLAKQYGKSIKWAIAGRNKAKLDELAKTTGLGLPAVIIADSTNDASLKAMCAQATVIATTAGPFARYGTGVVKACVEAGCDYCDITGEVTWVRDMIAMYDDTARKSGSRIVHLCGHDSIPWDLMTMMLAKKLKEEKKEDLVRVDMYDAIKTGPSGGTLETAIGIMFGPEKNKKRSPEQKALGYDPMLKSREGTEKSACNTKIKNVSTLAKATKAGEKHRAMFFMAGVNGATVKRSNALNHYGPNVTYCEGVGFKSFLSAIVYLFFLTLYGLGLYIPPVRWLLRKFVFPKPGEGPSEEAMAKGYLRVTGVAKGSGGSVAKATISFKVDPGYKDTARMLCESALALALDEKKLANPAGGVTTPAACQGEVLLDRLCKTGTSFTYH